MGDSERSRRRAPRRSLVLVVICAVLAMLLVACISAGSQSTSPTRAPTVNDGDQATLVNPRDRGAKVFFAVDKATLDEVLKAADVKDEIGLRQMGAAGRVELVPPGMRVLVLSTDWHGPAVLGDPVNHVRILAAGDYYGRDGWVMNDWLEK